MRQLANCQVFNDGSKPAKKQQECGLQLEEAWAVCRRGVEKAEDRATSQMQVATEDCGGRWP